jgi:hypothetical protein
VRVQSLPVVDSAANLALTPTSAGRGNHSGPTRVFAANIARHCREHNIVPRREAKASGALLRSRQPL